MKIGIATCTTLAGLFAAGAGFAASAPAREASPLALEWSSPVAAAVTLDANDEAAPLESRSVMVGGAPRSEYTRFRPRRRRAPDPEPYYRDRGPRPETFSQLHVGFMDPEGPETAGFLAGFRGGLSVDRNLQIGGQVDWRHRSNAETFVVSEGPGPGGTVITTRSDLARSSSDLVPLMAFIQVSAGDNEIVPYFGAGAGVEVLHLAATNFQTGEEFDGTFSGFGWQIWGGVGMPLSGRTKLNAEAFYNAAELSRDVEDVATGQQFRETVDMDGAGMRVGLSWGF